MLQMINKITAIATIPRYTIRGNTVSKSELALKKKEKLQMKVQELTKKIGEANKTLKAAREELAGRKQGALIQNNRSYFHPKKYFSFALSNLRHAQAVFERTKEDIRTLKTTLTGKQVKLIAAKATSILEDIIEKLADIKTDGSVIFMVAIN